jgi:hypothetical protein
MRLGADLSVNARTVIADLQSIAAFQFDDAPPRLYRQPSSGVGCTGLATLRYHHPVDNNEKLAFNCAQLHAMLLVSHAYRQTGHAARWLFAT